MSAAAVSIGAQCVCVCVGGWHAERAQFSEARRLPRLNETEYDSKIMQRRSTAHKLINRRTIPV